MMSGTDLDEWTPDEANALAALRTPADPSPDLYGRVRAAFGRRGAFEKPGRRWLVPLAVAAAIVLAYVAGLRAAADPVSVSGPQYAFFLLNRPEARWPDSVSQAQIVEEFRLWAQPLAVSGRLALGDELAGQRRLVDLTSVRTGDPAEGLSGFFVVTAPDDSAAVELARTLPHVRQGGVVAVQRLLAR